MKRKLFLACLVVLSVGLSSCFKDDADEPFIIQACDETPLLEFEGAVYNTMHLAGMCWLSENFNRGEQIAAIDSVSNLPNQMTDNGTIERFCATNDCRANGGFYQWNEMMNYDFSNQGICPTGWHIATSDEWDRLFEKLVEKGTETVFAVHSEQDLPQNNISFAAGGFFDDQNVVQNLGEAAYLWTSDEVDEETAIAKVVHLGLGNVSTIEVSKSMAMNVRCVKD